MQLTGGEFDVIVIGSGRSGRETALAATREGCSTLLISLSPGTIASMMWSTSDESPLKQELIQAFIPSGDENGKEKKQPTVTIQTTLNQPDRESSVYVLQAQVQRRHRLPGADASAVLQIGEPKTPSGQSRSLREREMRIREKLLRRNSHHPEPDDREDTECSYESRANRSKTSVLHLSTEEQLPEEKAAGPAQRPGKTGSDPPAASTERSERRKNGIAQKGFRQSHQGCLSHPSSHFQGSEGSIIGVAHSHGPNAPEKTAQRRHVQSASPDLPGNPGPGEKTGQKSVSGSGMGGFQGGKSATARKETGSKGPKAVKMRFAEEGAEKKKSMEDEGLPSPSPRNPKPPLRSSGWNPNGRMPAGREANKRMPLRNERKKKVSFIEREQPE